MGEVFLIIVVILLILYNVIYYIPNKLREQSEKQALYVKELSIKINVLDSKIVKLESKIDKIIELNEKKNDKFIENTNEQS